MCRWGRLGDGSMNGHDADGRGRVTVGTSVTLTWTAVGEGAWID